MKKAKKPTRLKVENVAIGTLKPDPDNPRRHDERNLEAIKASLKRFGQRKPIVVGKDGVVQAGNGTLAAAKALRWKTIAVVRSPLVGGEARKFAMADNRTGELSDWDIEAMQRAIDEMKCDLDKIDIPGFCGDDLRSVMETPEQLTFSGPPEAVQKNVDEMERVAKERKRGKNAVEAKGDTERYLIIVFDDRTQKNAMLQRLNLPDDERYIAASMVDVRPRLCARPSVDKKGRRVKSAASHKSGACG